VAMNQKETIQKGERLSLLSGGVFGEKAKYMLTTRRGVHFVVETFATYKEDDERGNCLEEPLALDQGVKNAS